MTRLQSDAPRGGVRIVGLVLTVVVGVPFVFFVWIALSSRFATGSGDPHGYGLIFGTFLALVAGILLAMVVPLMFPTARRGNAYLGSLIGYVIVAAGLVVSLLTA
ncbi:hypothetical protein [Microbacterium sp. PMB16]|uniref:hypothetical protein n=1 Tax=Microbacterium sp. PMB16 TaxID=3120157 RepID=UPI003F4B4992